jgi:RNA polymerase sigma factor (sigma-70 family)
VVIHSVDGILHGPRRRTVTTATVTRPPSQTPSSRSAARSTTRDTFSDATDRPTAELIAAARAGDSLAYEEVIHRYEHFVWSIVRSFRLSNADAHDAVQATWLRLVENLGRLRDPEHLGSWLATTASRECLRIIRRGARETWDVEERLAQRADEVSPAPEESAVDGIMAEVLWEHVAVLPPRGQALLRAMTRSDAPAYAELSQTMNMPIGSIGPTRGRYLRRLRQHLESAGLGADAWR